MEHTFAICAYKESVYLETCIRSLKEQTIESNIIMVTSTPNEYLVQVSKKYNIPLFINKGEAGITQDWNFAYDKAETNIVTIAHQDDVYLPYYTEEILRKIHMSKRPLIAFTDYAELREKKVVCKNSLLRIKRILLFPLRLRCLQGSKFVRRRILSLGSPICCPAVTYVKDNLPHPIFKAGFRSDEDWEAWEKISKLNGEFLYCKRIGMYHRLHEESETSIIIGDDARKNEDFIMFKKFWPDLIARILTKVYSKSEKSNQL